MAEARTRVAGMISALADDRVADMIRFYFGIDSDKFTLLEIAAIFRTSPAGIREEMGRGLNRLLKMPSNDDERYCLDLVGIKKTTAIS